MVESGTALDAAVLAVGLGATQFARTRVHACLDSTQAALIRDAARLPDRSVVIADRQSAGRGRRGRSWSAPPGATLALSMLAHVPEGRRWAPGVTLALGVAAALALRAAGLSTVGLKWPNDLLVDGRKLGGILVESCAGRGIVAGIGINIALPDDARQAIGQDCVDLRELGSTLSREQLAIALVPGWNHALDLFLRDGLDAFQMQWQALDLLASLPVRVLAGEGTVLDGIAQGIDAQGQLQVVVDGKLRRFSSAEVSVRPA